jgi:hypothetical protein
MLMNVHQDEITHNAKALLFPLCGLMKVTVCSKKIFRESGWEAQDTPPYVWDKLREIGDEEPEEKRDRGDSIRRSRQKVLHMAMLNPFAHFITWTLNAAKIDRYSPEEVSRNLKKFLQNCVQRYGLTYLIIPEHHKDGAIHMHGLISGNMTMIDSGKRWLADGRTIYNMPQWKYGWTTAIPTQGDPQRIAHYITKYITKAGGKIFGNYYYAGGRDLIREAEVMYYDVDYDEFPADKAYTVLAAKASFKYLDIEIEQEGSANHATA